MHPGKLVCVVVAAVVVWLPSSALGGDSGSKLHHESRLQIRATPVGASLMSDTAWRMELWPDKQGDLFDGTHLDLGVGTAASPAYLWGGPYIEILPIAALNLRTSVQLMRYWGTFGYLYLPTEDPEAQQGQWDDEVLDRAWDEGLGEAALGWKWHLQATPQMMVGRVVATAETSFRRISMPVDDPYYEPYFDLLLAPTEQLWKFRPTVGYLFGEDLERSHLLVGLRWERVVAARQQISRDTVGVVWNWGVPPDLLEWGSPSISGFAGAFIAHPTRGTVAPYAGMEASVNF